MPKGWKCQAPLTFASWNQIIQDMRNIYKLKDLISIPVSVINHVRLPIFPYLSIKYTPYSYSNHILLSKYCYSKVKHAIKLII